ncbi:MAG: 50S ribosomal protein L30e [Candidatus Aenigmatarchaeota archaeon]|nr:MAG: 50S ribosomal protein L30e [Candidatus Aenigmarchaeota archaeon]
MAKKRSRQTSAGITKEIKDAMDSGKLVIGSNSVIKGLKNGAMEYIICSSNMPENRKRDINHYASVSKTGVRDFEGDSAKLGETCGKPFNVLLIGIKK